MRRGAEINVALMHHGLMLLSCVEVHGLLEITMERYIIMLEMLSYGFKTGLQRSFGAFFRLHRVYISTFR